MINNSNQNYILVIFLYIFIVCATPPPPCKNLHILLPLQIVVFFSHASYTFNISRSDIIHVYMKSVSIFSIHTIVLTNDIKYRICLFAHTQNKFICSLFNVLFLFFSPTFLYILSRVISILLHMFRLEMNGLECLFLFRYIIND